MATLKTIENLKATLSGGGARPNLFEVDIPSFPLSTTLGANQTSWGENKKTNFNFLCKAAALPASNVASIDVPFRGRVLKVAGDRTFDTWTVTIINDENFLLRNSFEAWMNSISKLDNNTGATNVESYSTDAIVKQLGRGAKVNSDSNNNNTTVNPLKIYKFFGIFPTNVSSIDLSYDSTDTLEEFTVEFQVQYWRSGGSTEEGDQSGVVIS